MTELVKEFWAIIGACIAFGAWIIRLEARANLNSREILNLQKQIAATEIRHAAQRSEDIANRQRDWDQMNSHLVVIQRDIKELLQRSGR